MPKEVIHRMKYSPSPDPDFLDALKETADGKLTELQNRLEKSKSDSVMLKRLLLQAGDVITPAGLTIRGTTLLECAIGSGDPEIIEVLKPYFLEFKDGEDEREIQLKRYRHCIEEIKTQKPEDLTWLIDIILASSPKDVAEELATGDHYDPGYQSPLRDAFNKFRADKLDPAKRIVDTPRVHCNYQNLIHAYEILDNYWDRLIVNGSYDKHHLISRQIIGLIQLLELPAYERYVFARGQIDAALAGKEIQRSFAYLYGKGSYPHFSPSLIIDRVDVGFKSYISIFGRWCGRLWRRGGEVTRLISNKNLILSGLMQHTREKTAERIIP